MDKKRHLSTVYSQDINKQKSHKIDIFRQLSPLPTELIIIVIIIIIKNKYINTIGSFVEKKFFTFLKIK